MTDYTPDQWLQIHANAKAALLNDPKNARARRAFQAAEGFLAQQRQAANAADVAAAQPGKAASAGLGFSQGATFGFGDEAAGLLAGLGAVLPGGQSPGQAYRSQRDETRQATAGARAANPLAYWSGELAAAIPTLFASGAKVARLAPTAGTLTRGAARAAGSAATGGALAATEAAGRSEGTATERVRAAARAATYGATAGLVIPPGAAAAIEAVAPVVRYGGRVAQRFAGKAATPADRTARALRAVERMDLTPAGRGPVNLAPTPRAAPDPLDIPAFMRATPAPQGMAQAQLQAFLNMSAKDFQAAKVLLRTDTWNAIAKLRAAR